MTRSASRGGAAEPIGRTGDRQEDPRLIRSSNDPDIGTVRPADVVCDHARRESLEMADTINHVETRIPPSSRPEGYRRFYDQHLHLTAPFGSDWFGRKAEAFARLFGTPAFLITQTALVVVWIALNALLVAFRWDPYPFILLNLAFSTQAAYAAPLILLAQTRQADRDKALAIADAEHRDAVAHENLQRQDRAAAQAEQLRLLLESNTQLTEQNALLGEHLEELMRKIHARVFAAA